MKVKKNSIKKIVAAVGMTLICSSQILAGEKTAFPLEDYVDNEDYCEEIYWEDFDNCVDWEHPNLSLTPELCENLFWPSTKKRCFKELEKLKRENGQGKTEKKN